MRKWGRRNRRLGTAAGFLTTVAITALIVTGGYDRRDTRLAHLGAETAARRFDADAQSVLVLLADGGDRARLDEGVAACEAALARYGATGRPDWATQGTASGLDPADRERLQDRAGELLVLLGRATARRAVQDAGRADPTPALQRAFDLTTAALACYAGRPEPRSVWEQRAELARLLGRPDDARQMAQRAAELPPGAAADRLLAAHRHLALGQHRAALPLLRDLNRDDRQNSAVWYMLGVCNLELAQDAAAVACLSSCVALRPDCHLAWYQRGRAMQRLQEVEQAKADFERVTTLRPDFPLAALNKAAGH